MAESAAAPRVEVNVRWILVLLSVVPFLILRGHRTALLGYCIGLSVLLVLTLLYLPRKVAEAERRFSRDALRLLALRDFAGVEALAGRQRLLAAFGRRHVLPEALGLAAAAAGRHEDARTRYAEALAAAAPDERLRIEVNLAGEELATGRLEEAEGRYRAVLRRRPDLLLATTGLARILVARGTETHEFEEAAALLERALPQADARELPGLRLAYATALKRARAPRAVVEAALESAREAGADPVALAALVGPGGLGA